MSLAARVTAAIAFAGLMVAAQVAPLVHLVLVPHVTCAAHGELVHSDGDEAPVPEDAAFTATEKGDDHEHCLTLNAQRTTLVSAPAPRVVSVECLSVVLGAELPAQPTIETLGLAPKASPPA
jgi:hypothetical protein